ncbi:hypothetical protein AOQ84DRAFT_27258 [Glonium stellatum]|uniref:Uncharacterized protein n=1 Tax=Glonium stellatum TaxID=574774 RepID=A0A8E2FCK8_9PEZI|nr:hypothetical protein AOQ84DRAFT_27258 [Glonium stellatum]
MGPQKLPKWEVHDRSIWRLYGCWMGICRYYFLASACLGFNPVHINISRIRSLCDICLLVGSFLRLGVCHAFHECWSLAVRLYMQRLAILYPFNRS